MYPTAHCSVGDSDRKSGSYNVIWEGRINWEIMGAILAYWCELKTKELIIGNNPVKRARALGQEKQHW